METSEKLAKDWSDPTSLQEASLASPSVLQASSEDRKTSGGCGPSLPDSFAYFDPVTCLLRTSQDSFDTGLRAYSATFPRAGMMRNGKVYRRRRLVARISARGSGLWPTPNHSDGMRLRLSTQTILNAIASHAKRDKKLGAYLAIKTAVDYGASPTPELSEYLMGFPIGWTDLEDAATPSCPK